MRERVLFFFLGFWAILGQVIFLREALVILFGNEITIGLFYGVWFAGIFIGALTAASFIDRLEKSFSLLNGFLIVMIVLTSAGVVMLRLGRGMFEVPVGQLVPFSTMAMILACAVLPLSVAVGAAFPTACRVAEAFGEGSSGHPEEPRFTTGTVYIFESLGGLAAGLLHSFFLVTRFRVFPSLFQIGGITFIVLLLSGLLGAGKSGTRALVAVASLMTLTVLIIIAVLSGMHRELEAWTVRERWHSFAGELELIESVDSRYQNIALAQSQDQFDLYLNGNYTESFPDTYSDALLAHFIMVQHPAPRHVLVIGSGMTGFLEQILLHNPEMVDYVEIDGSLVSFLEKYIRDRDRKALSSPVMNIILEDGRYFIKRLIRENRAKDYDVVILNLPEPANALINRFYTRDFYTELSRVLSPSGVVITGLPFSENYIREEVLEYGKSVYNSLSSVFREVVIDPGSRIFFIATDSSGVITTNAETLASRYRQRGIESSDFSEYFYEMLLQPDRVDFVREAILGPELVPENTDTNPVTYYLGYMLWDRFSGGNISPCLRAVKGVRTRHLLAFFLLVFILRVSLSRLRGEKRDELRSFSALFSIFTTGAAGMSVSVVLMFSFQNAVGYLYGNIGALIALFMFGLAAGGWFLRDRSLHLTGDNLMILLEAIAFSFILLLSLGLPSIQKLYQVPVACIELVYYLMMFFCGVCTGAEFPVTSSLYIREPVELGRGSGVIDALDHGGALFGALVTGVILLPVMGVAMTLGIVAGLKAVGLLFWFYGRLVPEDEG